MKKILIFPYSNQLGTTIPSITLAKMLTDNGYKVEYASRGKYTFIIKEKGYKVYDVPEISYMHYRESLNNNRMDYYSEHAVRLLVDYEVDLIREVDPDIVVGHNRQTLYISTKIANKKYINLTIASLTRYFNQRVYIPENHPIDILFPFGDVNRFMPKFVTRWVYDMTLRSFAKGFNKNLKYFGLKKVRNYSDLSDADLVLLTETYGLVDVKELPENYYYLEQDVDSCFGKKHGWIDELKKQKNGRKIIFVNMGSSSFEAYPLVIKNLVNFVIENSSKYILISNHCGLEKEYTSRDNIFIEKFIDPKSILEIVDVVITHGGKNSLNEAIMAKKPVIGIPEQVEQLWNLKYAESLGLAKTISRFKLKYDKSSLIRIVKDLAQKDKMKNMVAKYTDNILQKKDVQNHSSSILKAISEL